MKNKKNFQWMGTTWSSKAAFKRHVKALEDRLTPKQRREAKAWLDEHYPTWNKK